MKRRLWIARSAVAIAMASLLAACGDNDDDPVPQPPDTENPQPPGPDNPQPPDPVNPEPPPPEDPELPNQAQAKCDELNELVIPSSEIGLPTRGATVVSTELVPASGSGATAAGEYCRVLAAIAPVDITAPDIRFQLNLPTQWNGKALMQGGGGYNGSIPNTTVQYTSGPVDMPSPLGRGYATFSSDSGHQGAAQGTSQDGSFGLNDEALANFASDALKKTRDAAIRLIATRYEAAPTRTYFVGGSTGGREALAVVQRWPEDFDGAISIFPAWNAATLDLFFGVVTQALAQPGGYPDSAKQGLVYESVMDACDTLDGAADRIISNPLACGFNPEVLRCPSGADEGDSCLSDAQIQSVRTYSRPAFFSSLGSGESMYPGFPVLAGADMRGPLALNQTQPEYPSRQPSDPYFSVFWDQFVRFFVTRDPNFNYLNLDPRAPGPWEQRISDLSAIMDINETDLSAFQAKGGKLLLVHGMADALVSPYSTMDYYGRLQQTMTSEAVDEFVRFYLVPGYGHVVGTFQLSWDSLTALEQWVEQGLAPSGQVARDANPATFGRTRPLCEFPGYPQYTGSGDPNLAESFRCAPLEGPRG